MSDKQAEILVRKSFLEKVESCVGKVNTDNGKVFLGVAGRLWPDGMYHLAVKEREFDAEKDADKESFSLRVAMGEPPVAKSVEVGEVKDMTIQPPSEESHVAKPGMVFEDGSVFGDGGKVGGEAKVDEAKAVEEVKAEEEVKPEEEAKPVEDSPVEPSIPAGQSE